MNNKKQLSKGSLSIKLFQKSEKVFKGATGIDRQSVRYFYNK
jgi:hypothetical protein